MSLQHSRQPQRDIVCTPEREAAVRETFAAQIEDGVDVFVDPDLNLLAHPHGFVFVDKGQQQA